MLLGVFPSAGVHPVLDPQAALEIKAELGLDVTRAARIRRPERRCRQGREVDQEGGQPDDDDQDRSESTHRGGMIQGTARPRRPPGARPVPERVRNRDRVASGGRARPPTEAGRPGPRSPEVGEQEGAAEQQDPETGEHQCPIGDVHRRQVDHEHLHGGDAQQSEPGMAEHRVVPDETDDERGSPDRRPAHAQRDLCLFLQLLHRDRPADHGLEYRHDTDGDHVDGREPGSDLEPRPPAGELGQTRGDEQAGRDDGE